MEIMELFPRDPRIRGVFWDYPLIIVGITLLYLWFVLVAGPQWMANRKPYKLKTATRIFNFCQVAANLWFVVNFVDVAIRHRGTGHFSFGCHPPTYTTPPVNNERDWKMLDAVSKLYFCVRVCDFLDTVFFVLAKKQSHVSFLHVYHHVVVVATFYTYVRSGWTPSLLYVSFLNAAVHVVMYAYYFLSTFPSMKPYLWWKKHLTVLQIVQFCLVFAQTLWNTIYNCGYPVTVGMWNFGQAAVFFLLFSLFYLNNYGRTPKSKQSDEPTPSRIQKLHDS